MDLGSTNKTFINVSGSKNVFPVSMPHDKHLDLRDFVNVLVGNAGLLD